MRDLDLEKKNYLSIEDFVCFINLFSGNFFRNRDAMMLFRRFARLSGNTNSESKASGVSFETFMNKVAEKN